MITVRIDSADTRSIATVVEVYQKGSGGQPDTLVERRLLDHTQPQADLAVGGSRFVLVREATEAEAKSIDNWSEAPAPPPSA